MKAKGELSERTVRSIRHWLLLGSLLAASACASSNDEKELNPQPEFPVVEERHTTTNAPLGSSSSAPPATVASSTAPLTVAPSQRTARPASKRAVLAPLVSGEAGAANGDER
jgi:hypothetical protein